MKKYRVFLAGMAAQDIEAAKIKVLDCCVEFYGPANKTIATFHYPHLIGWLVVEEAAK